MREDGLTNEQMEAQTNPNERGEQVCQRPNQRILIRKHLGIK